MNDVAFRQHASSVADELARRYVERAAQLHKLAESIRLWKLGETIEDELWKALQAERKALTTYT